MYTSLRDSMYTEYRYPLSTCHSSPPLPSPPPPSLPSPPLPSSPPPPLPSSFITGGIRHRRHRTIGLPAGAARSRRDGPVRVFGDRAAGHLCRHPPRQGEPVNPGRPFIGLSSDNRSYSPRDRSSHRSSAPYHARGAIVANHRNKAREDIYV